MNADTGNAVRETPLDRARRVGPVIVGQAAAIEAGRALTPDVLDALHGERLFRCLLPRRFGGEEAHPADHVRMVIELARHDASTAWCVNQASGCSMGAAYVPAATAERVWGRDARAVVASGAGPEGVATVVEGGYRVTGQWLFGSGNRHATWMGGHCRVLEPDGSLRRGDDGESMDRTMLFPRAAAKFSDGWDVLGLRGTGSTGYAVTDLFVPDDFAYCRDTDTERQQDAPLYQFTTTHMFAAGFAGVALGIARGMLDAFVALARSKTPRGGSQTLRDSTSVQRELALAEGRWRAARAGLLGTLNETWDAVSGTGLMTPDLSIDIRLASTYAIHEARHVADIAWREAGATAIFSAGPFERRLRDIHAVTQQIQGRMSHMEAVGRHLLGDERVLK